MNIIEQFIAWLNSLFQADFAKSANSTAGSNSPKSENSDVSTDFAKSASEVQMTKNLGDYLREKLPNHLTQFSDAFASAANAHTTLNLSPQDFALLHAAVVNRESFYESGGWA